MKTAALFACLTLMWSTAIAQSPEAMQHASWSVVLFSGVKGDEPSNPIVFSEDGKLHLEFVPASQLMDAFKRGGQTVKLGDVLSALIQANQTIAQLQQANAELQAENDKLWKVAMKDAPQPAPAPTVVVQQAPPAAPDPLARYALLRSMFLPPPTQNVHLYVSNCTQYPALCAGR
jgi:hypothetical protein